MFAKTNEGSELELAGRIGCPRCGSRCVRNGYRYDNRVPEQTYKCANLACGHRFCLRKPKSLVNWDRVAESYLFDNISLESVVRANNLPWGKSTVSNRIRQVVANAPSGIEFSEKVSRSRIWGGVLNLDTSGLKFHRKQYSYLQFSDIPSGDQLDYGISQHEDKPTIISRLGRIRYRLRYLPKLVVSDLAPELIEALDIIYPEVPIQGCLFHLEKLLNKKLPTWKLESPLMRNQISLLNFAGRNRADLRISTEGHRFQHMEHWANIKEQILKVARPEDRSVQRVAIAELNRLDTEKDRKGHLVIRNFLEKQQKYYRPRDDLEAIGITEEMLYSNRCENDIGRIKRLWRIHKGFKNLNAARKYVDFYWWKKRASRIISEDLTYYLEKLPNRL